MCCATRAATSWPTMGGTPDRSNTILATGRLLRRFATRRSRRIGLRISGGIEKNAPADANGRPFAGNGKGPPGRPQNNLGPMFAIETTRIKGAHLRDSSERQAALDAPTAVNVTVQASRRREVRRSSRPSEDLTEREIEKLMDATSGNRWGHPDAAAILLPSRLGLRASELVALRWDDVDFRTGKLHVRRSKGGQPSVPPIGGRELRALRRLQREGSRGSTCSPPSA